MTKVDLLQYATAFVLGEFPTCYVLQKTRLKDNNSWVIGKYPTVAGEMNDQVWDDESRCWVPRSDSACYSLGMAVDIVHRFLREDKSKIWKGRINEG